MWIRLGVNVPLSDEEIKKVANGDGEDIVIEAMKTEGFSIDGDSYVPEQESPTGNEIDLYFDTTEGRLQTQGNVKAKYELIKSFVVFTMNFPPYEEVIKWIAEHQKTCSYEHLKTKWEQYAKHYSTSDAWLWFYMDSDDEIREAMVDYITNVFAPNHVRMDKETLKEIQR